MRVGLENVHTASALRDWVKGDASMDNVVRDRMSSLGMMSVLYDVDSIYRRFESMEDSMSTYRTFAFRIIAETAKVSLPVVCDPMYDSIIM